MNNLVTVTEYNVHEYLSHFEKMLGSDYTEEDCETFVRTAEKLGYELAIDDDLEVVPVPHENETSDEAWEKILHTAF